MSNQTLPIKSQIAGALGRRKMLSLSLYSSCSAALVLAGLSLVGCTSAKDLAERDRLQAELDELQSKLDEVDQRLQAARDELAQLRAELDQTPESQVQRRVELTDQIIQAQRAIGRIEHERSDLVGHMSSISNKIAAIERKSEEGYSSYIGGLLDPEHGTRTGFVRGHEPPGS